MISKHSWFERTWTLIPDHLMDADLRFKLIDDTRWAEPWNSLETGHRIMDEMHFSYR